jgi:hypothetical protein
VSNYLLTVPQPLQPQSAGKKSKSKNKQKASSVTNLSRLLQGDVPSCIPGAKIFNEGMSLPSCVPGARIFNEGISLPPCVPGAQIINNGLPVWNFERSESDALYKLISSKLDAVVTLIDGEKFSGDEKDLWVSPPPAPQNQERQIVVARKDTAKERPNGKLKDETGCPITTTIVNTNYFTKVDLYANSKLPADLPPVKLYVQIRK